MLTTFLFARPSFVEGMARLVDFGNTLQIYNTSLTSEQADALAIASDWLVVGSDLKAAILQFDESLDSEIAEELDREARKVLSSCNE